MSSPQVATLTRQEDSSSKRRASARAAFYVLGAITLAYALLAGLRTVQDFDFGWQMATARWIVQHHQVPKVDVLSYTAQGEPWTYPVGAGLIFYAAFLLGGYSLISWLGALACVGTVALLLRRGSAVSAAIAILAVPLIAYRTTPRADMFTVVLFAAFLSLLWENYQTGRARLSLLPLLMLAWVNLHFGFAAGLGLMGAYVGLEVLEAFFGAERRRAALARLRAAAKWLAATAVVTLLNPWGWGIYTALLRQGRANSGQEFWIAEWTGVPLNWTVLGDALRLRQAEGAIYLLLAVALVATVVTRWRSQFGAGLLLLGAMYPATRYVRMGAVFACVVVVVAGSVLGDAIAALGTRIRRTRLRRLAISVAILLLAALAGVRSWDAVSNRLYFRGVRETTFGAGLGWWFPQRAVEFVRRNHVPGEVLNSYDAGGYMAWALGPEQRVYIDGRDTLYGLARIQHSQDLLQRNSPDSAPWQQEAARYNINTVLLPLARYDGVQAVRLQDFCSSTLWRPVYLDEISAVFVRRSPQTDDLVHRFPVDCATAPLPPQPPGSSRAEAFNTWSNAAGVLLVLGRHEEALAANSKALAIFPDSGFVHVNRGDVLFALGRLSESEQEYLAAVRAEPSEPTWAALSGSYQRRGRLSAAVAAAEHQVEYSRRPYATLVDLGYLYLQAARPDKALQAFDRAAREAPPRIGNDQRGAFDFMLAQGRSGAWEALGESDKAITYQEAAARLASPDSPNPWRRLARLYQQRGRTADAERARQHAESLGP